MQIPSLMISPAPVVMGYLTCGLYLGLVYNITYF